MFYIGIRGERDVFSDDQFTVESCMFGNERIHEDQLNMDKTTTYASCNHQRGFSLKARDDVLICSVRETVLPSCPRCRRYVPQDSRFCMSCGLELTRSLLPASPAVPGVCPRCGGLMQRICESKGDAPFYTHLFGMEGREFYRCTNCRYRRRL